MEQCDCLSACPFFNDKMAYQSGMAAIYKRRYCKGDFMRCARHLVKEAIGQENIPADLYPNMHERVDKIIAAFQSTVS